MAAPDTDPPKLAGRGRHVQFRAGGFTGALIGLAVGAVGVVLALVFSLVILPIVLGVGLLVGGYVWWTTRQALKALREQQQRARVPRERVVEGEVIRVDELDRP